MTNKETIYRQDVLDLAKKGVLVSNGNYESVCKAINELPSVNPQPCEDAISREHTLAEFKRWYFDDKTVIRCAELVLKNEPPVTPQPKTGYWIEHPEIETSTPEYLMFYECSECGDKQCFCKSDIHKKHFCNNCGARMIEPQERSGEE